MPQKHTKPEKSQPQAEKFKAMAKELDCDESDSAFDQALKKVAKPIQKEQK